MKTNIKITGGYLSAGISEPPVRVYFTDGGIADGYIDTNTGGVMLYDDHWNDGKSGGKTFHTLKILSSGQSILLSRNFSVNPAKDPVELAVSAQGALEFRAPVPNPNDLNQPYIPIDTVEELALIGRVSVPSGRFLLMRDLDLLGVPEDGASILVPPPHNWTPIPGLQGTFDGGGRQLANLYIDRQQDYVGLFAKVDPGTVKNVRVSGFVRGVDRVGGIAGWNHGTIENCSFDGEVAGNRVLGGIAGEHINGAITACYNAGDVTGSLGVGGIAGQAGVDSDIIACYNTGAVTATSYSSGGIAGYAEGTITACYNVGTVTGSPYYGSLVGDNRIGTAEALYWLDSSCGGGIGSGSGDITSFSDVFTPNGSLAWGTGAGETNGWWKTGTTGGGQLPRLWWEP